MSAQMTPIHLLLRLLRGFLFAEIFLPLQSMADHLPQKGRVRNLLSFYKSFLIFDISKQSLLLPLNLVDILSL